MHKKLILVGVDYSKTSKMALKEAVRIASAQDCAVQCVHVMDQEIIDAFRKNNEFNLAGVMDFANARLEQFAIESVDTTIPLTTKVLVGNPFREIIKAVNTMKPDLLVLGANGFSNRYSGRAGVLASRCVGKAPVDVMLVRRGQDEPFKSMIVCVDFSENSIQAAYKAGELAVVEGASLTLVHIHRPSFYSDPAYDLTGVALSGEIESTIIEQLEKKLRKLSRDVQRTQADLEISTSVKVYMRVSSGVKEQIDEVGADLVVLGTRGTTGLRGFLMGTTAERIIHDSECSVYTIKSEDFEYDLD